MTAKGAIAMSNFRRSLRFSSRPILESFQSSLRSGDEVRNPGRPLTSLGHVIQFGRNEQASIRVELTNLAIRAWFRQSLKVQRFWVQKFARSLASDWTHSCPMLAFARVQPLKTIQSRTLTICLRRTRELRFSWRRNSSPSSGKAQNNCSRLLKTTCGLGARGVGPN